MTDLAVAPPKNTSLVAKMASRFSVPADRLLPTLKATAFRQREGSEVSNEQMMALLIVAEAYSLNPFTKEIYAFPDKGGIVPVVSIDGWSRIANEHPQFDGAEFEYGPPEGSGHKWIDCIIFRKDRSHPTRIREFRNEVARDTIPWRTHANRMHRHKAFIQCARLAFGFAGIYDADEAQQIIEINEAPAAETRKPTLKDKLGATKQPVQEAEVVAETDAAGASPVDPAAVEAPPAVADAPKAVAAPSTPPPVPFKDLLSYAKKAKSKDQGDVVLDSLNSDGYTEAEKDEIRTILNSKAYHNE